MEKRTLLAVVLSISILLGYQYIIAKIYRKKEPAPLKTQSVVTQDVVSEKDFAKIEPPKASAEAPALKNKEQILSKEGVSAHFSSRGAVIKKILLEENGEMFSLIAQENTAYAPFALWLDSVSETVMSLGYKGAEEKDGFRFEARVDEDITVEKNITFGNSKYGMELEIVFNNTASYDKKANYLIVGASNIDQSNSMDKRFSGVQTKINGVVFWEKQKALKGAKNWIEHEGVTDWVSLRNIHYEAVLKPRQPVDAAVIWYLKENNSFACGLKMDDFVIPANSSARHKYLLYSGPTSYKYLSAYNLEDTIYFGKLDFICKFLLKLLRFFYGITHNYGAAIVVLTLSMGIVLFPLTKNNFRAMRQMQLIQPEISKLRESHKGNPQKLQRETMELYRKHKVNPLGGCLPMFLQMPIFISLYLTIVRSVELKGANFLWIKDLSAPDAVFKLPFKMPFMGEQFNLLPILMIVAMVFQQKVSLYKKAKADPQAEQQQKMMLMMPFVFGIIFYSLPSGLVLYWLTNTILMTLVQFHIAKAMPAVETITG